MSEKRRLQIRLSETESVELPPGVWVTEEMASAINAIVTMVRVAEGITPDLHPNQVSVEKQRLRSYIQTVESITKESILPSLLVERLKIDERLQLAKEALNRRVNRQ